MGVCWPSPGWTERFLFGTLQPARQLQRYCRSPESSYPYRHSVAMGSGLPLLEKAQTPSSDCGAKEPQIANGLQQQSQNMREASTRLCLVPIANDWPLSAVLIRLLFGI